MASTKIRDEKKVGPGKTEVSKVGIGRELLAAASHEGAALERGFLLTHSEGGGASGSARFRPITEHMGALGSPRAGGAERDLGK